MAPAKDLTGRRFGTLIANHRVDSAVMKRAWSCQCDCGVQKNIRTDALLRGATQSCGTPSRHLPVSDPSAPFFGPVINREQAIEQGLKWYVTGHPCKEGHVCERQVANYRCRECGAKGNADRCKDWYESKGKAQVVTHAKQWVKDNPEKRKQAANKWACSERADPIRRERKNKMRREGNRSELHKVRYQNDQNYRLMLNIKSRIQSALKAKCGRKAFKTAELLGCTVPEFKAWISSQFSEGMSWENWSLAGWHIDHIRPCASFDLTDPEQQRQCFHYTNQQPLWAKENMSKGDTWEPVAA